MTFLLCLGIAVLFGSGCYLLLRHDLVRVVGGLMLIGNAATLFIMATRLSSGQEPIYPLASDKPVSDPLVQAMALTAVVIGFGVAALALSLVYRVYMAHRSLDTDLLAEAEERQALADEAMPPAAPGGTEVEA